MQNRHRMMLVGSALLTSLALFPAGAAQAATAPVPAQTVVTAGQVSAPGAPAALQRSLTYWRGYRNGYRRGVRDGYRDCRRKRVGAHGHRGGRQYTRGWAAGYLRGYRRVCGR
ncbi:hypothetical protein DPM19_09955 [Actinomadura craniellae]|uniref:BA14K family protein n=1 Tax=Actinomadura craniellae TaxID=2231787 RepID=A0A365H7J6_9ACTN|nr:hypothetical protein [Actinomadura craniellae]RAY15057.1 hypothetical protein DPM19_09955 [Actinomadura craniellae]